MGEGDWEDVYTLDTRTGVIKEVGLTGEEDPQTATLRVTDPATGIISAYWRLIIDYYPQGEAAPE